MPKNQYEVQGIIGKRRKKNTNKYEYHVVWKGYSKEQATWEPEANLTNVADLVEEFNKKIEKNKMMSASNSNSNIADSNKMEVERASSINTKQKVLPKQQTPPLKKAEKRPAPKKTLDDDDNFQETKSAAYQVPPQPATRKTIGNKSKPKEKEDFTVKKETVKNVQPPNTKKTVPQKQAQLNNLNNNMSNMSMNGMQNGESIGPQFQSQNEQLALQIVGMFLNEYGKISYAVYDHQNNTKILKDRKELIAEQPKALIRFYEKNMNLSVL